MIKDHQRRQSLLRIREHDEFFRHENQAVPPALSDMGVLRACTKSDLIGCLHQQTSAIHEIPSSTAKILDGSVVIFPRKVSRVLQDRKEGGSGSRIQVQAGTPIPTNWQSFLRVEDNKTDLYHFLAKYIADHPFPGKTVYSTLDTEVVPDVGENTPNTLYPSNHEEADTRLLLHAQHCAQQGHKTVLIRTVDTDVVVLAVSMAGSGSVTANTTVWPCIGVRLSGGQGRAHGTAPIPATEAFVNLSKPIGDISDDDFQLVQRYVVLLYDRTSHGKGYHTYGDTKHYEDHRQYGGKDHETGYKHHKGGHKDHVGYKGHKGYKDIKGYKKQDKGDYGKSKKGGHDGHHGSGYKGKHDKGQYYGNFKKAGIGKKGGKYGTKGHYNKGYRDKGHQNEKHAEEEHYSSSGQYHDEVEKHYSDHKKHKEHHKGKKGKSYKGGHSKGRKHHEDHGGKSYHGFGKNLGGHGGNKAHYGHHDHHGYKGHSGHKGIHYGADYDGYHDDHKDSYHDSYKGGHDDSHGYDDHDSHAYGSHDSYVGDHSGYGHHGGYGGHHGEYGHDDDYGSYGGGHGFGH
ncbi:uncharacterized protein LOC135225278 [Macrobrachium nipponense]|uniref:uncharacterized protein LOC135225278 n=1 Tax=Macrobrachium nipponense TaxID=159736 RepID=UPI0030C7C4B0